MDFLAAKVIDALQKTQMAKSWIEDKKANLARMDRLTVLRSMSNLDDDNLRAVCSELDVDIGDMVATLRVLTKL